MIGEANAKVLDHLPRRCSHSERPFGPEEFVAELEQKLGRKWKRWTFEKELSDASLQMSLERLAEAS